jgi:hypothetical protein
MYQGSFLMTARGVTVDCNLRVMITLWRTKTVMW